MCLALNRRYQPAALKPVPAAGGKKIGQNVIWFTNRPVYLT
jgi:hypothetical protein